MLNNAWVDGFDNRKLSLIIFTTEKCNFRCTYCYEDFKLGKISDDTVDGILKLLDRTTPNLDFLSLSYFGGEPLLNNKAISIISSHAKKLAKKFNIQVDNYVTTNGYLLTPSLFHSLCEISVNSFQITLDGDKAEHDELRPLANGNSTFDIIINNIQHALNTNLEFNLLLRLNICHKNINSVKAFLSKKKLLLSNDGRVTLHFHPVFETSTNETKDLQILQSDRVNILGKLISHAKLLGYNVDESNTSKNEVNACYASKPNNWVIRADGRVQKCTVALDSEINNIGQINKDGLLNIDNKKVIDWATTENKGCPAQNLI